MRVTADIFAISVTIEDEEAVWTPDAVETMLRLAGERALELFRNCETQIESKDLE